MSKPMTDIERKLSLAEKKVRHFRKFLARLSSVEAMKWAGALDNSSMAEEMKTRIDYAKKALMDEPI